MATMEDRLLDLSNQLGFDNKALQQLLGNLTLLPTNAKGSIVAALNEVYTMASNAASSGGATINNTTPTDTTTYSSNKINSVVAALINDLTTNGSSTWSSTKINSAISTAVANLVGGAPAQLDTLKELADALGDAGAISAINTALSNRVRHDINNQGLTATQKLNARTNIDAYGSVEIGNPNRSFLDAYLAAKTA